MTLHIHRRLRISGFLLIGGLVIEVVTLLVFHPLTFLVSLFVGAMLIAAGIIVYLVSLVSK